MLGSVGWLAVEVEVLSVEEDDPRVLHEGLDPVAAHTGTCPKMRPTAAEP